MPNNFRNLLIRGYSTTVQADNDPVEVSQRAETAQSKQDVPTRTLHFKLENEGMLEGDESSGKGELARERRRGLRSGYGKEDVK